MRKKIYGLLGFCFIAMISITLRLIYLQIQLKDYFIYKGEKNFLRMQNVQSLRGNITDKNGTLLATNRPVTCLFWLGTGNTHLTHTQHTLLELLEKIVDKEILSNTDLIKKLMHAERYKKDICLAQDLSFQQLSKIAEQCSNFDNITIITECKRYYPYGSLASHLLGYLGTIGEHYLGKMGLEKIFENSLQGSNGKKLKIVDSLGRKIEETTIKQALIGTTLTTTLDIHLQTICEKVFPSLYTGALILMDPYDGAIKAILSRPHFDPTIFLESLTTNKWNNLQKKQPFLNRSINATYPPGSLFKLITTSAALEQGIINQETPITCKGFYTFGNRKYWCSKHHGNLTLSQAIAQSCNIIFFDSATKIDIDVLADYAQRFGLGLKTKSILPDHQGIVPSREWKQENKGERWYTGETLSISIGQSYLSVTPLQIACMTSAIFTGFLVKPRFLMNESIESSPLNIADTTRLFLKKSMKHTVRSGTGKKLHQLKDIKVYAKTSTAQTSSIQYRTLGDIYLEHGWFAGNFIYKNYPALTLVILVEHAGSAQIATGIAKQFLLEYTKYMSEHPYNS